MTDSEVKAVVICFLVDAVFFGLWQNSLAAGLFMAGLLISVGMLADDLLSKKE